MNQRIASILSCILHSMRQPNNHFQKKEVYCSFLRVNILKHLADLGSQNSNENQYGLT